jgi:hypothetical protein
MKYWKSIVLSGVLVAFAASAAPTTSAPKPVSFLADAKVEVDANGKLVKVEASPDLPDGVRRYIEQEVSKWTFKRNPREGETGNAISYIDLGACAVPTPTGGYSMGLAMHGNGPRIAGGGKWWIAPELQSVVARYELSQVVKVHFSVQPDGTAKFVSLDGMDANRKAKVAVERAVAAWLRALRFDPEQIGGHPVATQETLPVEFRTSNGPVTREDLLADALQSPQCRQAAAAGQAVGPGLRAAALDSVIAIEPAI